MIDPFPRPSDCVKGSPFEKLLWYAWYVVTEDKPVAVSIESKRCLETIIESAAGFHIDQMNLEEMRLTTFRLLRWEIDKKVLEPAERKLTLSWLAIFIDTLKDEELTNVDMRSICSVLLD